MFTRKQLEQRVDAYRDDQISRQEFHNWFEDNSFDAYGPDSEVREACVAIDTAFSEYLSGEVGEESLKDQLENALRPFALSRAYAKPVEIVIGTPRFKATSASFAKDLAVA